MMQSRRSFSRRFRHIVMLQKNTPTQDDNGQPIESWSDVSKLRCEIIPKSAKEFARNENIEDSVDSIIRCRFIDSNNLDATYRLTNLDSTIIYNITGSYEPDQTRKLLEIHVTQEVT